MPRRKSVTVQLPTTPLPEVRWRDATPEETAIENCVPHPEVILAEFGDYLKAKHGINLAAYFAAFLRERRARQG